MWNMFEKINQKNGQTCGTCYGHSSIAFATRLGEVCNFELSLLEYGT